jgi:hypothetical protein
MSHPEEYDDSCDIEKEALDECKRCFSTLKELLELGEDEVD